MFNFAEIYNMVGGLKSHRSWSILAYDEVIQAFLMHIWSQHFNWKTWVPEHDNIHIRIELQPFPGDARM